MVAKQSFLSGTVSQRGKPVRNCVRLAGSHGSAIAEASLAAGTRQPDQQGRGHDDAGHHRPLVSPGEFAEAVAGRRRATDMTPGAIHVLGLSEVTRIKGDGKDN